MGVSRASELGRDAFARQAWDDAYTLLTEGEVTGAEDLERLAVAAQLTGRDDESARAWERAHVEWVRLGDRDRAAQSAFWVGLAFALRGEMARAGGWFGRADRVLEGADPMCAARGFLLVPPFLEALACGDAQQAYTFAGEMLDIAQQSQDKDLLAFGLLARGQAEVARGDLAAGVRLLDEVMVSVTMGEVSPILTGIVYCAVIEACMELARPPTRSRVDRGARRLVLGATGPRAVPRAMSRAPIRDPAGARCLDRGDDRGGGGAPAAHSHSTSRGRARAVPAGGAAPTAR